MAKAKDKKDKEESKSAEVIKKKSNSKKTSPIANLKEDLKNEKDKKKIINKKLNSAILSPVNKTVKKNNNSGVRPACS